MGLINITDVEYVCDLCGKHQKRSEMVDNKNGVSNEIFEARISCLNASVHEPNIVTVADGMRMTKREYFQVYGTKEQMIICPNCMNSLREKKHSINHITNRHNNVRQPLNLRNYSGRICDLMENLLNRYNIYIPDENRNGEPDEACLFGDTYYELENNIVNLLDQLVEKVKSNPTVSIDKDNL